jgi:uncharacterized protein YjbJ (UPF0337 family)
VWRDGELVLHTMETVMDWEVIERDWKQFKEKVKQRWCRFTDENIDMIAGRRDQLVNQVEETYCITREEAEKQIRHFEERNEGYRASASDRH